jgi:uncharacterized membrane protein YciS (DUF1049 family)
MHFFLFLAFVIAVAFVSIAFQNPDHITLTFIKWDYAGPLAAVLAVPFAAGLLAGICVIFPSWWKRVMLSRSLRKRVKELEAELAEAEKNIEVKVPIPEPVSLVEKP